jgi:hypothetical protein
MHFPDVADARVRREMAKLAVRTELVKLADTLCEAIETGAEVRVERYDGTPAIDPNTVVIRVVRPGQ